MDENKLKKLQNRDKPPKYAKYKDSKEAGRHLVKVKKELDYYYHICDYCGTEIPILQKTHEMTGGIVELPITLTKTKGKTITLALCNKCLKSVLSLFEKWI